MKNKESEAFHLSSKLHVDDTTWNLYEINVWFPRDYFYNEISEETNVRMISLWLNLFWACLIANSLYKEFGWTDKKYVQWLEDLYNSTWEDFND